MKAQKTKRQRRKGWYSMKIAIDKQAFAIAEKATAENFRNEWKSDLTDENVRNAARWLLSKMKVPASVLVSIESATVTKMRDDVTIWINAIMRGVDVFTDVAFDFCAALVESDSALMTARAEVFKRV